MQQQLPQSADNDSHLGIVQEVRIDDEARATSQVLISGHTDASHIDRRIALSERIDHVLCGEAQRGLVDSYS